MTAMPSASLVYHTGALGDFLTTLPAMTCWKAAHPRLVLLGRPAHGALARYLFDDVWDAAAAEFSPLFGGPGGLGERLSARFAGMESALVFARAGSPLLAGLAAAGLNKVLRQDPFPETPVHAVDYHLSLFPAMAAEELRVPRVPVVPSTFDAPGGVAVHFGSGSASKNWPVERFAELARRLAERGETVWWIAGPAEAGSGPGPEARTWRSLPLTELASRLARCQLFVGNDSGVTHLAAAAGCPVVALFGASDHRVWAPRGIRVRLVLSPTGAISDIRSEDVLRACLEFLEKT
jgi:heptosyltransferase III